MIRSKNKAILVLTSISLAITLISWGVVGHRAIGRIAENHLSKNARNEVRNLLGYESMAMVSTYADEVRSYKEHAHTGPWHYVNIPLGLDYTTFKSQLDTLSKPNVYKAINNCVADLKNPAKSKPEKVYALKFLIHLVGDLHQPMHLGRAEDQGGNKIDVKFMPKETNLHGLWDTGLIDYAGMTYLELAQETDVLKKKDIKIYQQDEITKWAFESYKISEDLYAEAAQNKNFDFNYYPKHAREVHRRLAMAGVRLAGLLNAIYK